MPIFARLAKRGVATHVLQFTWADEARRAQIRRACESGGAGYRAVPVMRRPVSAGGLATALAGARHVAHEITRHSTDVVMPRSTLPALSTARALRKFPEVQMIFDADGLPHDERVDFGGWSAQGLAYRLLRDLEASAVRRADAVLTRSRSACDILAARAGPDIDVRRFVVVGNGRDPDHFTPASPAGRSATRRELGIDDDAPLLVYAGSVGTQYCVPQMLAFFRHVRSRREDSRMLMLTGSPGEALDHLRADPSLAEACLVRHVPSADVPRYLAAADIGLALRQPSFSMRAVAPIKLGEYLLCGVPVLATRGIGDSEELLPHGVGMLVDAMGSGELDAAADWFVQAVLGDAEGFRSRCREQGVRAFGIDATVDAFDGAIRRAMGDRSPTPSRKPEA